MIKTMTQNDLLKIAKLISSKKPKQLQFLAKEQYNSFRKILRKNKKST